MRHVAASLALLTLACGTPQKVTKIRAVRTIQDATPSPTATAVADIPAGPSPRSAARGTGSVGTTPPQPMRPTQPVVQPLGDVQQLVVATFPETPQKALAVAECESAGWRHDVIYGPRRGRDGELGLMQLHPRWHRHRWQARGWTDADMWNPTRNLAIAREIYDESRWSKWTCA